MTQSFKCPTFGFSSGGDLRVVRLSPSLGSMLSAESASDFISPSLCPSSHLCSGSLSQINSFLKLSKINELSEIKVLVK